MDEARALKDLMDVTGMSTAEIAKEIGFSQRYVQQRLQFLELTDHQQQALNKGDLSIREARNIVANKPKPLDLTDAEWLIVAEVLHAWKARKTTERFSEFMICHIMTDEERLAFVNLVAWPVGLQYPRQIVDFGVDSNLAKVWAGATTTPQVVAEEFGEHYLGDGLDALVAALQARVLGHALPDGTYATRWLNGPFETDPEVEAKVAQIKEERARQEEERVAQAQAYAEAQDRAEQAMNDYLSSQSTQPISVILEALNLPLPWTEANGDLVAANEEVVDLWDSGLIRLIANQMSKFAEGHQ